MNNIFLEETGKLPHENFSLENNEFINYIFENSILFDFFDIFASIVYTDFYTPRKETSLTKKIRLEIPVVHFDKIFPLQQKINDLVRYMTSGENWDITIVKYNSTKKIEFEYDKIKLNMYNSCALFSAGMDSFCGAYNEVLNQNKTVFVTFQSNDLEKSKAEKIFRECFQRDNNAWTSFDRVFLDRQKNYTERTRTLLFLTFGIIVASTNEIEKLNIYENGIMSLNPTFDFSRKVSKTTHPRVIYLMNSILKKLEINVKIDNPFIYKTKGQILNTLPHEMKNMILKTKTCSKSMANRHFAMRRKGQFHCGVCIACILRQISEVNANIQIKEYEYLVPLSLKSKEECRVHFTKLTNKSINKINTPEYWFNEKISLLAYYKKFREHIISKTIYNYIDISDEIYGDSDYLKKVDDMLNTFALEISNYMRKVYDQKNC